MRPGHHFYLKTVPEEDKRKHLKSTKPRVINQNCFTRLLRILSVCLGSFLKDKRNSIIPSTALSPCPQEDIKAKPRGFLALLLSLCPDFPGSPRRRLSLHL